MAVMAAAAVASGCGGGRGCGQWLLGGWPWLWSMAVVVRGSGEWCGDGGWWRVASSRISTVAVPVDDVEKALRSNPNLPSTNGAPTETDRAPWYPFG